MRIPVIVVLSAFALSCSGGGGGSDSTGPGGTVASVTVYHASGDSLNVGGTLQLNATAHDASGAVLTTQTVTWTSTNRNVLDVTTNGLVTGLQLGSATIGASIGNVTTNVVLRAVAPAAERYKLDTIATTVLGPASIGQQPNDSTGTADASAVELPDKRIRVYFGRFGAGGPGTLGSAISSDGVHFTAEAGLRQPADATPLEGFASPLIYALPGGGYRLFYNGCHGPGQCGISSSTSTDGLTFVADAGLRLPELTSLNQPVCSGIVKLAAGGYRMYCSQDVQLAAIGPASANAVFSATSPDLLNWTLEAGRRLGQGAPTLTNDAQHPTAIANADGSVSLIYYQRRTNSTTPREMISTSTDGLTFTTEYDLGLAGTEPSFVLRSDGSMLLFYGNQTATTGSTISLARVTPIGK
jgi:hypothetical protein